MDELRPDRRNLFDSLPLPSKGQADFFVRNRFRTASVLAVLAVFFMPMFASATEIGPTVGLMIAVVFQFLTGVVGELLILLVGALIMIAQYNGFVTSTAVANGWVIVRDISNMFFIIALLLIAFGTMLGIGQYHYSKTLPRLIIMAILVNFSRTICGLLIDFSQVVMLTFVNGFKEAAGGNFVNAFGLSSLMQQAAPPDGEPTDRIWAVSIGFMLAFILLSISAGVILIMIVVLVVRIVFLWLLVVLSPLAFLATAIPIGRASQFYGRWWDNFNKQVIVGPLMAFFLWLALISASADGDQAVNKQGFNGVSTSTGEVQATTSLDGDALVKFIISIALLLGGVAMAQEMSQGAVGFGKSVLNSAGKVGVGAAKFGTRMGGKAFMASGGELALNKMKTTALGLGIRSGIPLLKGASGEALGKHHATQSAKVKEAESWMSKLSSDERKRFKGGVATNPAARARQLAAHQVDLQLAGQGRDTGMNATDFNKSLKEAKRLGGVMNVDNGKTIIDAKNMSPKLIVDKNSIGAEHDEQVQTLQKVAQGKRAKFYEEANENQIDENVLSRGNSHEIARAMKNAHGTVGGGIMEKFAGDTTYASVLANVKKSASHGDKSDAEQQAEALNQLEGIVASKQKDFKENTANYDLLSSEEQATILASSSTGSDQLKEIGLDKIASTFNAAKGKEALATQLAGKLDADQIKKLPSDIADAIRGAMSGDSAKIMESGGSLNQAFKGYDMSSGQFMDAGGREKYGKWISGGTPEQRSEKLAQISPYEMQHNDGANDVAIEMVSNINASDLQNLMKSGKADQAQQIINVVNKLESVNIDVATENYAGSLPADLVGAKADSMVRGFQERLKMAKKEATEMINELSKGKESVSEMMQASKAEQKINRAIDKKLKNLE